MTTPTPRPWSLKVHREGNFPVFCLHDQLNQPGQSNVVLTLKSSRSDGETYANSQLIEKAVNAHDKLIAALELALTVLNTACVEGSENVMHQAAEAVPEIEAALALAQAEGSHFGFNNQVRRAPGAVERLTKKVRR